MNLRSLWYVMLGVLLVFGRPAAAAEKPSVVLDLVGHQGMLAYRVAKAYCQIGNDVRLTVALDELKASLSAFEGNLKRLKEIGVGGDGKAAVAELERLWPALRELAKAPVAREKAPALFADAQALQTPVNTLVEMFADLLPNGRESQLYLANRQRILSQELAALYMLQSWGFEDEAYKAEYREVVATFDEGLLLLSTASNKPPLVVEKLKAASKRWEMMKVSNQDGSGDLMPNMAVRMLDGILENIEAVAAAYLNEVEVGGAPAEAPAE
jgi:hypothetical protein